jgi:predicted RNA-binding Zn-ribbon protein involved in translation (DUF1610 family)
MISTKQTQETKKEKESQYQCPDCGKVIKTPQEKPAPTC